MQATYVFENFELDAARFELRRDGARVAIQPKELRLLLYLVANRGRVVCSRELLEVLWQGETVCPGSLKRAVRGARKALGDSGTLQARIRTVRRYGYEFVARELDVATHTSELRLVAPYARLVGSPLPGREQLAPALAVRLAPALTASHWFSYGVPRIAETGGPARNDLLPGS